MSITIIPTGKKLIIKRLPAQEITLPSGIHLPENASSSLSEGEVIVVSKEIEHIYKAGDIILFPSKKDILNQGLTVSIFGWILSQIKRRFGVYCPMKKLNK